MASAGGSTAAWCTAPHAPARAVTVVAAMAPSVPTTAHPEVDLREVEHVDVEAAEPTPHGHADQHAGDRPQADHPQDQPEVVQPHLPVRVAHGLERGDLLALQAHQPAQHHVHQEGRDQQEEQRHHPRIALELLDLLGDEAVRELVLAQRRPQPAVGLEEQVDGGLHVLRAGIGGEAQQHVVEGALHPGSAGQRVLGHPDHAEARIVLVERARRQREDELRREHHPHDAQRVLPALDHRGDRVLQAPGGGPWRRPRSPPPRPSAPAWGSAPDAAGGDPGRGSPREGARAAGRGWVRESP